MRQWAGLGTLLLLGLSAPAEARPSLILMISVDQLAGHYLDRWNTNYSGGFARLQRQAAWYRRGVHAVAATETAPGHANLATGAWPNVHGIVSNRWIDPAGRPVYCFEDASVGRSPAQLMVPTFADALRISNSKAKIISVSLKDRAAIPLGGSAPTLTAWYSADEGKFVAGRWPGHPAPPAWFDAPTATAAHGRPWTRFRPTWDYDVWAGPDASNTEADVAGLGRTFPRTQGQGLAADGAAWREVYPGSPAALDDLVQLAEDALRKEKLGRNGQTDYLAVGLSSLDYAGHWWGSSSQETFDILLRLDAAVGHLWRVAEQVAGAGNVAVVLSADHGVMPTPEGLSATGIEASRLDSQVLRQLIAPALGKAEVLRLDPPRVHLRADPSARLSIQRAIADILRTQPKIMHAVAASDLEALPDPFRTYFVRAQYPGRSGDVFFLHRPWVLVDALDADGVGVGTSHGSPWAYDTDVPIFVYGPGVKPGQDHTPYPITRVAPTLATLAGIGPPPAALDPPLPAVGGPRL